MEKSSYKTISWLFLRFLGLVYFCAFISLYGQLSGLLGSAGILPISPWLDAVKENLGIQAYLQLPTFFWLNSSDTMLHVVCGLGILFSIFLILDFLTIPSTIILWLGYLSLLNVGQDFLSFQWDALLVETGFLALWLPLSPNIILWLFRWLLFRLIFMSGLLKLLSGDPTWRSLTALAYHYETQPLPTPLAWYFYQLPLWFHKLSTFFVLVCETIIPLGFFGPRIIRIGSGIMTIFLQIMILLTGNYAFFNLLTLSLTLFLFDDKLLNPYLSNWAKRRIENVGHPSGWNLFESRYSSGDNSFERERPPTRGSFRKPIAIGIAVVIVLLSLSQLLNSSVLRPIRSLSDTLTDWHLTNTYGLFVVMTMTRPTIILEGSTDGKTWKEYHFKYNPQDLKRPCKWIAPYQPRMDWQLWFEALRFRGYSRWFIHLTERLLDGSPEVLSLFKDNPFPDSPPVYLRAIRYQYHFTDWQTRKKTGQYWTREYMDLYLPAVSLRT